MKNLFENDLKNYANALCSSWGNVDDTTPVINLRELARIIIGVTRLHSIKMADEIVKDASRHWGEEVESLHVMRAKKFLTSQGVDVDSELDEKETQARAFGAGINDPLY